MTARRPARDRNARTRSLLPVAAVLLLTLTACGSDDDELRQNLAAAVGGAEDTAEVLVPVEVSSELVDPEGSELGTASFRNADAGTEIEVEVSGMAEGFHPMYLSDVGVCETESRTPDDPATVGAFLSAGDLVYELPSVLVLANGMGSTTTLVAPELEELLQGDGTALVVTRAAEDLTAAPTDRDEAAAVSIGSRLACAAIGGGDV